jgi:hypothetical protein
MLPDRARPHSPSRLTPASRAVLGDSRCPNGHRLKSSVPLDIRKSARAGVPMPRNIGFIGRAQFIVRRDLAVTFLSPENRWLDDLLSNFYLGVNELPPQFAGVFRLTLRRIQMNRVLQLVIQFGRGTDSRLLAALALGILVSPRQSWKRISMPASSHVRARPVREWCYESAARTPFHQPSATGKGFPSPGRVPARGW